MSFLNRNKNQQPAIPANYDGYLAPGETTPESEALDAAMKQALSMPGTLAGRISGIRACSGHKIRAVDIPSALGTIHTVVSSQDEIDEFPKPKRTHFDTAVEWWQEGTGERGIAIQYPAHETYNSFQHPPRRVVPQTFRSYGYQQRLTPEEQSTLLAGGELPYVYDRPLRPLTIEEQQTIAQGIVSNEADPVRTQQEVEKIVSRAGGQWIPE